MNYINTFLMTSLIVLLLACGSESKPMSDVKDIDSTPIREDNQTAQSQENNWRKVYNLPYSISCMDERLGSSVVSEFQTSKRGPTQEEINKVKTCDILKDEDQKDKREDEGQKDKREDEGQKDKREDEDQKDKREGEGQKDKREDNQSPQGQVNNWREVYNLPYTVSCMDERLGSSVVSEFQTSKRGPTQEEINKVKTCEIVGDEGQKDKREDDDQKDKREDDDQKDKREDDDQKDKREDEGQKDKREDEGQKDKREDEGQKDKREDEDDMSVQERIEDIRAIHGGWIRTGDPKMDQFVLGYLPTADEWRCGVAAVGVTILRNIKAGKHLITDEENQKLQPCFRVSPDSLIHPLTQVWEGHCIPLEIFLEFVDYYRPSWEQLECHLKDLERYEMPNQMRYVMLSDPYGIRNSKTILFPPLWDRVMTDPFYKDLKLNFSPSMGNMSMPPSYDEEYNSMKCDNALRDQNGKLILDENGKLIVDEYWLHEALRGAAIAWIIEKKKGRRIYADTDMCTNAYIVQGNKDHYVLPPINSIQDFKDRTLNLVIPQYVIRAKAAEAVKAEMMQLNGLSAEIEVVFSRELFLGNLPPSQQVELAQWYLDTLIPEVRKHFHGTIWVASYANYDNGDPDFPAAGMSLSSGSHWKNLSFAAADYVSFTMYAACDFRHVERYFNIQYDAIMEIVQRDNIRWGGGLLQ